MLPGPNLIKECPQCRQPFVQPTLLSGNTFGASFWTDGKREAPMLPETPWVVKCPTCSHLVWLDEAAKLGEEDPFGDPSRWPEARRFAELSEHDYLMALSKEATGSPEKIRYLRMRAWWAANDGFRRQPAERSASLSEEARRNMEALFSALSEAAEEQRLMRAELARELGRFEEAERLLSMKYRKELHHAVRRIAELVNQRNRRVATL
jgi:hypothetical protein